MLIMDFKELWYELIDYTIKSQRFEYITATSAQQSIEIVKRPDV